MNALHLLTCALLSATTAFAAPYGDSFETGNIADYLEGNPAPESIRIEPQEGGNILILTDTKATFKTIQVTQYIACRLSFEAEFSGDIESLEDNPRFDLIAQPSERSQVLPSREIEFLNASGKAIGQARVLTMPFREIHQYTDDFHIPPDALTLRLKISSGNGVALSMRNLKLEKRPDNPETLNLNPTFALGTYNYSGWKNIASGGMLIESDGKTIFDTKYGSSGTPFPLAGPGTYAFSASATGNGYNATAHLDIHDDTGKILMRSSVRRFGKTNYFILPPDATTGSLLVYSSLLEGIWVKRVGDESVIETYRENKE